MTYYEAVAILNRVRRGNGNHISIEVINMALELTGDLDK